MKLRVACVTVGFLSLLLSIAAQSTSSAASAQVPPLIQFSNVATDQGGNSLSGVVSITFSLYAAQRGGEPLWTETQTNIQLEPNGHYSVQLGITKPNGVPTALFATGEARWLGVRIAEQAEQPRVLLVSVPYALKAGDAATIGGLPPSAFMLASPTNATVPAYAAATATDQTVPPPDATDVTTTGGTINYLPLFNGTATILDSVIFQSATSPFKIGINTATPASTLDVKGASTVRGLLSLPAAGTATSTKAFNSQALRLTASAFNTGTGTAVTQDLQWQAEPVGNNSGNTSGKMNLLYATGSNTPAETGLSIASNGAITATSFSGNGSELTNVTASNSSELGGLAPSAYAQLAAASNPFTGSVSAANLTATGTATAATVTGGAVNATTSFDLGGTPFAFGSGTGGNKNAYFGFAGNMNSTNTGRSNTGVGVQALQANTTGRYNAATGQFALGDNTTGNFNTASGSGALDVNTTGSFNTATGFNALGVNCEAARCSGTEGSYNTAVGYSALTANSTGSYNTSLGYDAGSDSAQTGLTNATAIGAYADVAKSNSLVLGSISGVNGAPAGTFVGIGTTAPNSLLTAVGSETSANGFGAALQVSNSAAGGGNWYFRAGATGTSTPAGGFSIADDDTYALEIEANGNVGILTDIDNPPDMALSVNGNADKAGGGSWATFSDRRLKTLNGSFSSGLDQILKINPVRYRYKEKNALGIRDHDEHVGLVAQDVQKVIPEAVTQNSKGYLLVNNDPIIWSMLNAIKEQQREIRALRSELRTTRRSLQKVQAQVAGTKTSLAATSRPGE
jgi:endosialidase-like protein